MNTGRQIDAINLAYAFGLTEQFAPVPLLKSYLKEARKTPHAKAGNMSPGAQVVFFVFFYFVAALLSNKLSCCFLNSGRCGIWLLYIYRTVH